MNKKIFEIYNKYEIPEETILHMKRVAYLSKDISRSFAVNEYDLQNIVAAALLHDVGKVMIPDQIINKPGRLNQLEFEIIKRHVQFSIDILEKEKISHEIIELVFCHHEKQDGTGYPRGITELSIGAQILSVADVFDALTSDRPYRKKMTAKEAIAIIKKENMKIVEDIAII